MSQKIRILSFHHLTNNGASLFIYSLMRLFQKHFPLSDVKVLDYKTTRLAAYETLKKFKFFQNVPLFYWKRSAIWKGFIKEHFELDADFPHYEGEKRIQQFMAGHYSAIVVGMDVWCLIHGTERPVFPNIYWLTEKMDIPKIAYGVSGYRSDIALIRKHRNDLRNYLDEFDVIGARDRFTYDMVLEHRSRSGGVVERIPDPAFIAEIPQTGVVDKLTSIGVNINQPLLGLLLFGDAPLSQAIQTHFKAKGYQILGLSMYNPFADFNLGHVLNPFEWANVFRLLSFCITDRYHGTIFCIKNQIPFISVEKERNISLEQSKLYDLLTDFDLAMCYINPQDANFVTHKFLDNLEEIGKAWEKTMKPMLPSKLLDVQEKHRSFISRMKGELGCR